MTLPPLPERPLAPSSAVAQLADWCIAHAGDAQAAQPSAPSTMPTQGGKGRTAAGVAVKEDMAGIASKVKPSLPAATPTSLREFLQQYLAHKAAAGRVQSIKKAIMHAAGNKRIELPPPVAKVKKGQTPRYRPEDLRARWADYQEVLTFLPALREE